MYTYVHFSLFSYRFRGASQSPYREEVLQSLWKLHKAHIEKGFCKASIDKGLYKSSRSFTKPKQVGGLQNPYIEGDSYRQTCTHMHISVFFPTDLGVIHKVPIEKRFCKDPVQKGLCIHAHTQISVFSYRNRGASQSSYREGFFWKAPVEEGLHTYIHKHMNISVFFPTDMQVLNEVCIEKGLCKAPRSSTKSLYRRSSAKPL